MTDTTKPETLTAILYLDAPTAVRVTFRVDGDTVEMVQVRYNPTPTGCVDEVFPPVTLTTEAARIMWRDLVAAGYERDHEAEQCDAGMCDHYTCTEGESLREWESHNRGA